MRIWSLTLVPLFAAVTFLALAGLRDRGAPGGAVAATQAIPTAGQPRAQDRARPSGVAVPATAGAPPQSPTPPIVDLQSYSEMERALIEAPPRSRGQLLMTLEIVKNRLRKLITDGRDACQAQERGRGGDPTDSQIAVSARVEAGAHGLRLANVTVTPWRGAALSPSFERCLQRHAVDHAGSPGLSDEPAGMPHPTYTGTHRMVIGVETACAAAVSH